MNSAQYLSKYGKKKKRNNREHELQKACVKLFRYRYPKLKKLLFAIPNGANLEGGAKEWKKLLAEGAVRGEAPQRPKIHCVYVGPQQRVLANIWRGVQEEAGSPKG